MKSTILLAIVIITMNVPFPSHAADSVSVVQCVALNDKALNLTPQQAWAGEGIPWMLNTPDSNAPRIGRVSGIIYVSWPMKHENGFVQVIRRDGMVGWLEERAIRPLRKSDGSPGGCVVYRRADGRLMFRLDPGVSVR